jgi:hypothetical protein
MRRAVLMGVLLAGLGSMPAPAAYLVTFSTDQSGGQTQIDVNHLTTFNFAVLSGAEPVTTVVGDFTMKVGSKTSADVTFSLWQGLDGWKTPGATLLASTTKGPGDFTQQFASELFTLTGLGLAPGNYSLALTSLAPDQQALAYFIKGGALTANPARYIDTNPQPAPPPVPEPASIVSIALGVGLAGLYGLRRRGQARRALAS